MRVLLSAALMAPFWLYGFCHAQETCPYINTATTSGALEAQAQLSARSNSNAGDVCKYSAGQGNDKRGLYVVVRTVSLSQQHFSNSEKRCVNKPKAVHALGNEAWSCKLQGSSHGLAIFGRVRDKLFIVQLTGLTNDDVLQDKTALAAEQVANNLY
jgi:hypothetical protein